MYDIVDGIDCENEEYDDEDLNEELEPSVMRNGNDSVGSAEDTNGKIRNISKTHFCLLCKEDCIDKKALNSHMRKKHKQNKRQPVNCKFIKFPLIQRIPDRNPVVKILFIKI